MPVGAVVASRTARLSALGRAGGYALSGGVVLVPAIWNGFPFIFADTGGYLARPFEGSLELGRSALYGAFLAAGRSLDFWPDIVIQSLLCVWLVSLVLRCHGLGRSEIAVGIVALCLCTSLPWYADQLMPDIFLPLSVLATYLVTFRSADLRSWEVAGLLLVVAFAVAVHMSILTVMLVLLAVLGAPRLFASSRPFGCARLIGPAAAVAGGIVLALSSNYLIAGRFAFTPGGSTFLFSRLLDDGFVKTFVDENCPDPAYALCRYRDQLPDSGNDWLWDGAGSPLAALGGWRVFAPEAQRIIKAILVQHPLANVEAVLFDTGSQLAAVATGDGFDADRNWHAEWAIPTYAPQAREHFLAAAQQHNAINFDLFNWLHVPLALGATVFVAFIVFFGRKAPATASLALTVFIALLANAAVCATFSGVNDRYQSRLVFIAVLAAALACREVWQNSGRPSCATDRAASG